MKRNSVLLLGTISVLLLLSVFISTASAAMSMSDTMSGVSHATKICYGKPTPHSD